MIKKHFEYIVIGLILVVFLQGIFSTPEGISKAEEMYRLKIHDLSQEKALLLKENNDLETKLNDFEHDILQNDSIVSSYSTDQLDSAFIDYFKR